MRDPKTSDWLLFWFGYLTIPMVCSLIVMLIVAGRAVKTKTFWIMMPVGVFLVVPFISIVLGGWVTFGLAFAVFWGWFIRRLALSDNQGSAESDITTLFGKK